MREVLEVTEVPAGYLIKALNFRFSEFLKPTFHS